MDTVVYTVKQDFTDGMKRDSSRIFKQLTEESLVLLGVKDRVLNRHNWHAATTGDHNILDFACDQRAFFFDSRMPESCYRKLDDRLRGGQ